MRTSALESGGQKRLPRLTSVTNVYSDGFSGERAANGSSGSNASRLLIVHFDDTRGRILQLVAGAEILCAISLGPP